MPGPSAKPPVRHALPPIRPAAVPPQSLLGTLAGWPSSWKLCALGVVAGVFVAGMLMGGGMTALFSAGRRRATEGVEVARIKVPAAGSSVPVAPTPVTVPPAASNAPPPYQPPAGASSAPKPAKATDFGFGPPKSATPSTPPEEKTTSASTATSSPSDPPNDKPKPSRDPFEDLAQRGFMLELPPTSTGNLGGTGWQKLAEVYVDDPKDCELELVGVKEVFGPLTRISLEPPSTRPVGASRDWEVRRAIADAISGKFVATNAKMLASIRLEKSDLTFRWDSEMAKGDNSAKMRADWLKACLLKVRIGGEEKYCALMKSPLGMAQPIQLVGGDTASKKTFDPLNSAAYAPKGPPPGVRVVKLSHDQLVTTVPLLEQSAAALPFKTLPSNLQMTLLPPRSVDSKLKLSLKSAPTSSQIAVDVDGQGHGFYFDLEVLPPGAGGSENPSPTLKVSVSFDQLSVVPGKDELKWEQKDFLRKNYDLTSDRVQKRIEIKRSVIAETEKKYNYEVEQLMGRAKNAANNKNPEEEQRFRQQANQLRETQKNDPKLNKAKEQLKEAEDMQKYLVYVRQAMDQFQRSVVIGFRLSLVHKDREIVLFEADPNSVQF